jgi:hypothetical protein
VAQPLRRRVSPTSEPRGTASLTQTARLTSRAPPYEVEPRNSPRPPAASEQSDPANPTDPSNSQTRRTRIRELHRAAGRGLPTPPASKPLLWPPVSRQSPDPAQFSPFATRPSTNFYEPRTGRYHIAWRVNARAQCQRRVQTRPPKQPEPRTGRYHIAWRVNARGQCQRQGPTSTPGTGVFDPKKPSPEPEFQTPILLSRPPHSFIRGSPVRRNEFQGIPDTHPLSRWHPFIRGSLVRRNTTASGHLERAEGECITHGKRWVSHIPADLGG